MTEREFRNANQVDREEVVEVISSASTVNKVDVTDILDEIDLVLEENAEEFVKSFVQKGGQ